MLHRTTKIAALALSAVLFATGCSSDGGSGSTASGETVRVHVKDMSFEPPVVTIQPGDSVEWVWEASLPHDVASDDDSGIEFVSELQTEGSYTQTFDTPGEYGYHCTPHPQMTGQVIVEG
ncbi:plastocyanin/azurin family copper-binding protein [Dietzia sp. B32]|uniref:cupredoxin domain-containing protein n=1 Tax=Dietzia sp. B32 TaxID=2915130 RepID=UPI0021ADB537|nr:plastocyanin/azurin family copper-binding protein [Dietzia sp. B32]UVE95559.1 plastocyanin/azurin family copper-binding protein [Dietzia sp. B32]